MAMVRPVYCTTRLVSSLPCKNRTRCAALPVELMARRHRFIRTHRERMVFSDTDRIKSSWCEVSRCQARDVNGLPSRNAARYMICWLTSLVVLMHVCDHEWTGNETYGLSKMLHDVLSSTFSADCWKSGKVYELPEKDGGGVQRACIYIYLGPLVNNMILRLLYYHDLQLYKYQLYDTSHGGSDGLVSLPRPTSSRIQVYLSLRPRELHAAIFSPLRVKQIRSTFFSRNIF